MEHTLALIARAHQGDKEARDTIFEENIGLIWSIVKRFQNRGVELEDLFQIGSIGLLKAVDKFDLSYDVKTIYQGEGNDIRLIDKLEEKKNRQEESLNRILLEEILGQLTVSERRLIYMRYFQERTQTEIARELGVSQVQVSRMEKKILKRLRDKM